MFVKSGATVETTSPQGFTLSGATGAIRTSGAHVYSNGSSYVFDGTAAQVTGNGLPATVGSIVLNNASGLTLNSPVSVTDSIKITAGKFDFNSLSVVLKSTASKTASLAQVGATGSISNGTNFTAERWLDYAATVGSGAYFFIGTPAQGVTINNWNTPTNVFDPNTYIPYPVDRTSALVYDPTNNTAASQDGWLKPSSASYALTPGKGAMVWFYNTFFGAGATASSRGIPVVGNYNFPSISYCTSNCPGADANGNNGWNLVANPYASTIDWDATNGWSKSNVGGAIYEWRHNLKNYAVYTGGNATNGGSNLVASGQAFFVLATGSNPSLTIKEAAKTNLARVVLRRAAQERIVMSLKDAAGHQDETMVVFNENASRSFDAALDAIKLYGSSLNFTSTPEVNSNMAINAMPFPAATEELALGAFITNHGISTISFTELPATVTVYLKDRYTNTLSLVTSGFSYSFSATSDAASQGASRFSLVYAPAAVTGLKASVARPLVVPTPSRSSVHVSLPASFGNGKTIVKLYDLRGTEMLASESTSGQTQLDVSGMAPGVYMLKISSETGTWSEKLVVE